MDISEQISALLNSPDGMDKLRSAADALLGGSGETPKTKQPEQGISLPDGLLDNIGNIAPIMRVMSLLQNRKEDDRVKLLMALKPHLSEERRVRVDKAVSMLKVASIIPLLKEEGLLDNLFGGVL